MTSWGAPIAVANYISDGGHYDATQMYPISERGLPAYVRQLPVNDAVGRWPLGASARSGGAAPATTTTYDDPAAPVRGTQATGTTRTHVQVECRALSTLALGGVAAKTPGLKSLASEVREAGLHPAARNNRTIAVGIDADGGLFAGSSNGFDAGQRAALARLGITRVPGSGALHAEEELLRGVPTLQRVGTSVRAPCGASEHNCALQLIERGVGVE
jgi:hypothetical protein